MSRNTKLLSVFFAAIMALSTVSAIPVFAESEVSSEVSVNPPEIPDEPDDPPVQPDVPDFTEAPQSYEDPDTNYSSDNSYDDGYNYSSNTQSSWNSYDNDGNDYNNNNSETFYVGGGQTYIPPKATAPSAALYNSDQKTIDDKTLNKNDWGDIANNLKGVGTIAPAQDDGSGDFNFIQKNTAKEDNGHWIIISGVLCLVLSVVGFIYLIVSAISRRKKLMAPAGTSAQGYYRPDDDYDDGYSGGKKASKNGKRYK